MKTKALALFTGLVILLSAQQLTTVLVQNQVVVTGGHPGDFLTVAPDGRSVVPAPAPPTVVFGSAASPGCVLQPDGSYLLPRAVSGIAVYRNGLRASMPGEYTLSGTSLHMATPIPGEVVICDYTY